MSASVPYLADHAPVLALAHRGGALHPELDHCENSLRAFQHAADLGYRYIETDVHLTSDGELVAFHDTDLDRVTDQVGAVCDLPLADVQRALIHGLEPVPTMAELLTQLPEAKFNVDLKADGTPAVLARLLDEHEAWDRVLVGSFDRERLEEFRRLAGDRVATSAHPREVAAYVFSPFAWLARLLTPGRPVALQVPIRRHGFTIVTKGLLRRAHANGVQVHVWTIDDPQQMNDLLDLGVDGLVTDRTDILKDVLRNRGLWRETA